MYQQFWKFMQNYARCIKPRTQSYPNKIDLFETGACANGLILLSSSFKERGTNQKDPLVWKLMQASLTLKVSTVSIGSVQ